MMQGNKSLPGHNRLEKHDKPFLKSDKGIRFLFTEKCMHALLPTKPRVSRCLDNAQVCFALFTAAKQPLDYGAGKHSA
jgi:hypothetical protein